jgi:pre-mRNA-processing factor 19
MLAVQMPSHYIQVVKY